MGELNRNVGVSEDLERLIVTLFAFDIFKTFFYYLGYVIQSIFVANKTVNLKEEIDSNMDFGHV